MYTEECINIFLEKQGQLFDEPVAENPEEAEAFMKIYHKIYSNLSETGCEETGKEGRNK